MGKSFEMVKTFIFIMVRCSNMDHGITPTPPRRRRYPCQMRPILDSHVLAIGVDIKRKPQRLTELELFNRGIDVGREAVIDTVLRRRESCKEWSAILYNPQG